MSFSRIDLTSSERAVQVYFLPLSVTLVLQSGEVFEGELGSSVPTQRRETKVAGGVGNGVGLRFRVGGLTALLEVRAIINRDLEGARSGSLPISIGVGW